MSPVARAAAAFAALSAWMVLLFSGFALGGAVHLVLVAGAIVFPWRAAAGGGSTRKEESR